ncbi:GTP 3',8-cyclase MoaA [Hahella sp. CR1]|uniref:GTP 3',8-cyclase MoaA n=1 Tax=Hahella sp. CR1 TaxID=2992807 RepID=UPI0032600359
MNASASFKDRLHVMPVTDQLQDSKQDGSVLQDRFGRRLRYLRLSITDICNFRCNYCLPDGYQCKTETLPLSLGEIQTLTTAFAALGTRKVRITGGEPAIRRDLPQIIHACAKTDGIRKVALTTNGYNLRKQVDTWADAGLSALNVSVDSLDPQRFHAITGHDRLHAVLNGVDRALELGTMQVKLNSVLLRDYNGDQLTPFLDWVKDKPVAVRFIELMQTGDNAVFFRANHISGAEIAERLEQQGWSLVPKDIDAGPAQEYQHPDYRGRIGLIMPYSKDFCATCNRLRVSSQGKLHLCLFAEAGVNLRDHLRNGDVVGTVAAIRRAVEGKLPGHSLHEGFTGAMSHLAMLGG